MSDETTPVVVDPVVEPVVPTDAPAVETDPVDPATPAV